jgi:hypothetical protein
VLTDTPERYKDHMAAVAIALDHLDELFDLMLCQVFAGRQRGIRRPAQSRMARNCSYFSSWRDGRQMRLCH